MNKTKTVKMENTAATPVFKEKKFPDYLYVHTEFEGTKDFNAYPDLEGVENGDIVAKYELKSIARVKVVSMVELEEIA